MIKPFLALFVVLVCSAVIVHKLIKRQLHASLISAFVFTSICMTYVWLRNGKELFPLFGAYTAISFICGFLVSAGVGFAFGPTSSPQASSEREHPGKAANRTIRSACAPALVISAFVLQIISVILLITAIAEGGPGNGSLGGILQIIIFPYLQVLAICCSILALAVAQNLKTRLASFVPLLAGLYFVWRFEWYPWT